MPRPADVFELVHPAVPDFRVGGWEIEFGHWQWFYVAGYRPLMSKAGLSNKSDIYNEAAAGAAAVPQAWRNNQLNGDWGQIAQNQLTRAINGDKMRFDRAVQSILCLELAVTKSRNPIDIYRSIQIRPAMFKLGRYSDIYPKLRKPTDISALQVASRQPNPELFTKNMRDGKSITYVTADAVNRHLTPRYDDLALFLISTKSQSGGTPSHCEQPMYP